MDLQRISKEAVDNLHFISAAASIFSESSTQDREAAAGLHTYFLLATARLLQLQGDTFNCIN